MFKTSAVGNCVQCRWEDTLRCEINLKQNEAQSARAEPTSKGVN